MAQICSSTYFCTCSCEEINPGMYMWACAIPTKCSLSGCVACDTTGYPCDAANLYATISSIGCYNPFTVPSSTPSPTVSPTPTPTPTATIPGQSPDPSPGPTGTPMPTPTETPLALCYGYCIWEWANNFWSKKTACNSIFCDCPMPNYYPSLSGPIIETTACVSSTNVPTPVPTQFDCKACEYEWVPTEKHPALGYWSLKPEKNKCNKGCYCPEPQELSQDVRLSILEQKVYGQYTGANVYRTSMFCQQGDAPPAQPDCGMCQWIWRTATPKPQGVSNEDWIKESPPRWYNTRPCNKNCSCREPFLKPEYPQLDVFDFTFCTTTASFPLPQPCGVCYWNFVHTYGLPIGGPRGGVKRGSGYWYQTNKTCGANCNCRAPDYDPLNDYDLPLLLPIKVGMPPTWQQKPYFPQIGEGPHYWQTIKPIKGPWKEIKIPWPEWQLAPRPTNASGQYLVPNIKYYYVQIRPGYWVWLPYPIPSTNQGGDKGWPPSRQLLDVVTYCYPSTPFALNENKDFSPNQNGGQATVRDECEAPRCVCMAKPIPCGECSWQWFDGRWNLLTSNLSNTCMCDLPPYDGTVVGEIAASIAWPTVFDKNTLYFDCYPDINYPCTSGCDYPWDALETIEPGQVLITGCSTGSPTVPPQYAALPTPLPTLAPPTITQTPLPTLTTDNGDCNGECVCTYTSMAPFGGFAWSCKPSTTKPPEDGCSCGELSGVPNFEEILSDPNFLYEDYLKLEGIQIVLKAFKSEKQPCANNCEGYCYWIYEPVVNADATDFAGDWKLLTLPNNECSQGCSCKRPNLIGNFIGQVYINQCRNEAYVSLTSFSSTLDGSNNSLDTSVVDYTSAQADFTQTIINSSGQVKVISVKDSVVFDTKVRGIDSVLPLKKQP